MNKLLFICLGMLLFSCSNSGNHSLSENSFTSQTPNMDSLKKCIPRNDTTINARTSIEYIIVDSFYTIKLKLNGIDTILNYKFTCNVPRGLVPAFYSYFDKAICLIKGSGQHYREFVIAYSEGKKIVIKNYETALATDLKTYTVVYQNYSKPNVIIVENIKTASKKKFLLPNKYVNSNILKVIIQNKRLEVSLSNGSVVFKI